jgi:glycosyltransferase involved in cell wall biosynthesis
MSEAINPVGSEAERRREVAVVILGLFPPPVTGAAKNNLLMLSHLREAGVRVVGVATSAGGSALSRSLSYHFARAMRFIRSSVSLIRQGLRRGPTRLYFVPDGGLGAWYSLGYALIARGLFADVILHHRTFQYIDSEARPIRLLCRILEGKITHVMLSSGMRDAFLERYGQQPAIVSTNARYVTPRDVRKAGDEIVIGHLSNLCRAKGFFEVVETFERLAEEALPVRLLLAGPVVEDDVQEALDALRERWPSQVEYFGPVSGDTKDAFYDRVHVFLFPTRWAQEAQPNVVYEAMAGGAANIAFARGCIGEMIPHGLGIAVPIDENFIDSAVSYICSFSKKSAQVKSDVLSHLEAEKQESIVQFEELERRLVQA